jgi:terminal uridylyltransferase
MRASRILASRPDRAIVALAELCEERKDEELVVAPPYVSRSVTLPPQTPYTVGNQTMRPKVAERFSPPTQFFEPGPPQVFQPVTLPPPEHMAPKRGKWTSPPPPEAPSADHTLFESQLGIGLQLATLSTEAREKDTAYNSSESNSEIFTDEGSDETEDDIKSVRSYTEGSSMNPAVPARRPSWQSRNTVRPYNHLPSESSTRSPSATRGRSPRTTEQVEPSPPSAFRPPPGLSRFDFGRRSTPGRPRSLQGPLWTSNNSPATSTPLPPSPESPMDHEQSNVFYQTTTQSPRPTVLYPSLGTHSSLLSQYQSSPFPIVQSPSDILPENFPPSLSSLNPRGGLSTPGRSSGGPDTPTPASYSAYHSPLPPTPAITPLSKLSPQQSRNTSPLIPSKYHPSSPKLPHRAPPPTNPAIPDQSLNKLPDTGVTSPSGINSNNTSPAPSSSGYYSSISRSPSPPATAVPLPLKQKDDGLCESYRSSSASDPLPSVVESTEEKEG